MIGIEVFSQDFIFGNFRASDYGLILVSFNYNSDADNELGIAPTVIEEFIGYNPVPIYLGQKYENKLELSISVMKNPCIFSDVYFTEKELRSILRITTGQKYYQWLKLFNQKIDEDLWYRARISNVSYKKVGGNIIGIIFTMSCDSAFAWSNENNINIKAKPGQHFYIHNNTDDLYNYIYPYIEIISTFGDDITVTNISDNNWTSEIQNVKSNEKITIDSQKEIITSNIEHVSLLNDFNLHYFRLIPDKNEYVSNTDIQIVFKYRVPRKVGFTE